MATVLITGGTGLIGRALTQKLISKDHKVIILTRQVKNAGDKKRDRIRYAEWDVQKGAIEEQAIKEADYIVHLAGANVADGRWTEKRKKEIVESRTKSGALLVKAVKEIPNQVKAVISSSAIGWYGPDPQVPNPHPFTEEDKADASFLGHTCRLWEESIEPIASMGRRLVKMRTGIVLSVEGGAYAEFKKPLNWGLATVLGSGKQVISWIHIEDVVRLYLEAIENERWRGVYNIVAPNPVSNRHLIKAMAKARGRFYIPLPVPEVGLKVVLGEMSVEVLKSATVSAQKVLKEGFEFIYPTVEEAVQNLSAP